MARAKAAREQTTEQRLLAIIKSARNIMRTDPGLNGDLDRVPQMAWLLFLKAFDDLESDREAVESGYSRLLPEDLRWREWAGKDTLTGDQLLKFVNGELLPGLRTLPGRGGKRTLADVLHDVYQGVENRMRSGYQMRELLNVLNGIHFESADDIHTMARIYETLLREVRDAAGDSGEFYTPRPLIRFVVQRIAPKPDEIVLDPACGTGGFLVETLDHLRPALEGMGTEALGQAHENVRGMEKKPQAYMLGTMNLVLHEVDVPNVVLANALMLLNQDRSRASQVDVVMTNPPFGGAEEKSVRDMVAQKYRTSETAWLFLITIIEKLRDGGRCGIIVPNGVLFEDNGAGRAIKEHLFTKCDLHTVVRLPDGVFAPYTDIPSNILFFDKGRPTKDVWFYQIPPPEGRKKYSKTRPMPDDAFAACTDWWGGADRDGREPNDHAWKVPGAEIAANGYNLDLRNPNAPDDLSHRPPEDLVKELITTEEQILDILRDLQGTLEEGR